MNVLPRYRFGFCAGLCQLWMDDKNIGIRRSNVAPAQANAAVRPSPSSVLASRNATVKVRRQH